MTEPSESALGIAQNALTGRSGHLAQIEAVAIAVDAARAEGVAQGRREAVVWQPIETAPRGLDQLLFYFPTVKSGRQILGAMMRACRLSDITVRQPTHWMPLPEPPANGEKP